VSIAVNRRPGGTWGFQGIRSVLCAVVRIELLLLPLAGHDEDCQMQWSAEMSQVATQADVKTCAQR
jgi:hypothetical protein